MNIQTKRQYYFIQDQAYLVRDKAKPSDFCVFWRFQSSDAIWAIAVQLRDVYYYHGPLSPWGLQTLVEGFKLQRRRDQYTIADIVGRSPLELIRDRRHLELEFCLSRFHAVSSSSVNPVPAMFAQ